MARIKFFHSVAVVLFMLYGLLTARSLQGNALAYWIFWFAYVVLLCGLMQGEMWCARLLILPPLLVVVFTAPMILYNFFAFVSGNPLYQDSPATIIVVAIVALLVTMPSAFVLGAYWNQRQQIFGSKATE